MCYGFGLESDIEGLPDPMADDGSDDGSDDGLAEGPKAVGLAWDPICHRHRRAASIPWSLPRVDIRR
jgi:hypothetical protein